MSNLYRLHDFATHSLTAAVCTAKSVLTRVILPQYYHTPRTPDITTPLVPRILPHPAYPGYYYTPRTPDITTLLVPRILPYPAYPGYYHTSRTPDITTLLVPRILPYPSYPGYYHTVGLGSMLVVPMFNVCNRCIFNM